MHTADIEKTAIATPSGLFEFMRMTFGLRNQETPSSNGPFAGWPEFFIFLFG
jgi:hypothetical protein